MSINRRRSNAYSTYGLLSHDMADRVGARPTTAELWRADTRPTTEVHDKTTELNDKTCTDTSTRNAARHSGNDVSQRHNRVVPPYISRCVSERSGKRSTTITNTRQRYNMKFVICNIIPDQVKRHRSIRYTLWLSRVMR